MPSDICDTTVFRWYVVVLSHQVTWRATSMMSGTHPPQHKTRIHIKCRFCFYTAEVVCMVHEFCCTHSKLEHILNVYFADMWCMCWYSCRTPTLQSRLPEHAVWWVWRWSIWHRWLLGNKSRLYNHLVCAPQYCYLYNGSMDQVFFEVRSRERRLNLDNLRTR